MTATARAIVPDYDPVLRPTQAAEYVGRISTRTLRKLHIERVQIPCTGTTRPLMGYRLSALNAYLARINDPKSRRSA